MTANFYWLLGAIFATVVVAMIISSVLIVYVLEPWWERRQDLRRMIGK